MKLNIHLNSIDKIKLFVEHAEKLNGTIDIYSGRYVIDGKSIMGIFSLDLSRELKIDVKCVNPNDTDKFISTLRDIGLDIE